MSIKAQWDKQVDRLNHVTADSLRILRGTLRQQAAETANGILLAAETHVREYELVSDMLGRVKGAQMVLEVLCDNRRHERTIREVICVLSALAQSNNEFAAIPMGQRLQKELMRVLIYELRSTIAYSLLPENMEHLNVPYAGLPQ